MTGMTGKTPFRNTTTGYVGAITYGPRGEEKAIPVGPGDLVWLSEEEQELTANCHRSPQDNPFLPRRYEVRDPNTDEVLEAGERPLLEKDTEERPTAGGAEAPLSSAPPVIEHAPDDSVQTEQSGPPLVPTAAGTYAEGEQTGT